MSENHRPFSLAAAKKYNAGQTYVIFPAITDALPDFSAARDSDKFALATYNYQSDNDLVADGFLGRQTYGHLLSTYFPVGSEYVISNTARIPLPKRDEYKLITFEEAEGLDLHRFGHFSTRAAAPSAVCVHWGGLNAEHCYNVFASPTRKVSSHFLIGLVDGEPVVYQVLDLQHQAWHGGKVNAYTIGVDICQQATTSWKEYYEEQGYGLSVIKNPTNRGERNILTLHPKLRVAVATFLGDLFDALQLPINPAPNADGIFLEEVKQGAVNLFSHSHVNRRKWDCAPWWLSIMSEMFDDYVEKEE